MGEGAVTTKEITCQHHFQRWKQTMKRMDALSNARICPENLTPGRWTNQPCVFRTAKSPLLGKTVRSEVYIHMTTAPRR